MNKRNQSLLQLLLIFAVFTVPVVTALLWSPQRTVNHGELVQPARPIQDVRLQTLDKSEFRLTDLRRKWVMVYFAEGRCEKACYDTLYKMRQVRLSQGRHANRIERLYVVTDNEKPSQSLRKGHPGLHVVTGTSQDIDTFKRQFDIDGTGKSNLGRLYIVDPIGNLMMSYSADVDPTDIRKDLARLLKASQLG